MKVLWAPWRMEYILSDGDVDGCILCPGDDRSLDEERLILRVDRKTLIIMNKYPYINGHLLVAPVRHVGGVEELSDEEMLDLMNRVRAAVHILALTWAGWPGPAWKIIYIFTLSLDGMGIPILWRYSEMFE